MWTLVEGVTLIGELKEAVESKGFSIALTGGVLFRGWSAKDIDLVFYPLGTAPKADYCEVLEVIRGKLGFSSAVAVNHPNDVKLVISVKDDRKKRIDLFFPSERFARRRDGLPVAGQTSDFSGSEE